MTITAKPIIVLEGEITEQGKAIRFIVERTKQSAKFFHLTLTIYYGSDECITVYAPMNETLKYRILEAAMNKRWLKRYDTSNDPPRE